MTEQVRVAVVTGGGRGIGRGIVGELAALGMAVVVNYRSDAGSAEESRREAEARGAPRAVALRADVADLDQGRRLIDDTLEEFGRIDVWVNNAGVAPESRLDLLETTPESWDRVLATNLRGPVLPDPGRRPGDDPPGECGGGHGPPDHLHHLDLEPLRQRRPGRVLRLQGRPEHGRPAVRDPAGRARDPRPRGPARHHRHRHDGRGPRALRPSDRRRPLADPALGHADDVGRAVAALASGAFPFSTGEVIHVDGGLHLRRL